MAAKGHRLSLGIGITYLLSKFHDVWWKTVLALIFSSFNLLRASIYPQCNAWLAELTFRIHQYICPAAFNSHPFITLPRQWMFEDLYNIHLKINFLAILLYSTVFAQLL